MLDDIIEEAEDAKRPAKNLKYALIALGCLVLASLIFFLALDSFGTGGGHALSLVFVVLFYALTIVSGVFAFLACRNSIRSLKTNKDTKNYVALILGGCCCWQSSARSWIVYRR